jgi:hypothetical protein
MQILEHVCAASQGSEEPFRNRSILFIGSESYDAPTITVLQGLHELGFEICTIKKPNINSWFCNKVVDQVNARKFDFALSNLHWGTMWSYYRKYHLVNYPKVLIDGDDNLNQANWIDKYNRYTTSYCYDPPESIKELRRMPYRWIEPLNDYQPDIVFTAQKQYGDRNSIYLPFGIHEQYRTMYQGKNTIQRRIDFAHIPGPGRKRRLTQTLIRVLKSIKVMPGHIHNSYVTGEESIPAVIEDDVIHDENVHSYHRWVIRKAYFDVLNDSKVLIYPGIDKWPFWDSKRPWEAYASGCLVLMASPSIDVTEYPITELGDGYAVYRSAAELVFKCRYLYKHPESLDRLRLKAVQGAWEYFSPVPIARYFLMRVAQWMGMG